MCKKAKGAIGKGRGVRGGELGIGKRRRKGGCGKGGPVGGMKRTPTRCFSSQTPYVLQNGSVTCQGGSREGSTNAKEK